MNEDVKATQPSATPMGGAVEPTGRPARARDQGTEAKDAIETFELRDPFAEVTYRAPTFGEIVAKARELDISRVTAVAEDGKRTPIYRIDGEWRRGEPLPARQERPLDLGPAQGDRPDETATLREKGTAEKAPPRQRATSDLDAERAELSARVEAALKERYIIKRATLTVGNVPMGNTEYRFRGDSSRVAFTESALRLATDTNSPSVARSMVDVAQARGWTGLRVSGNEDFRRLVWLEATVRGVKTLGYEPNSADLDVMRREQLARRTNRIEPALQKNEADPVKPSARGGGRKAVLAAIEAVLIAKGVSEARRTAVLAAATEKLAQRQRQGQKPIVKVYDMTANRNLGKQPENYRTPQRTASRTDMPR